MAFTAREARRQILDDLAAAIDQIALAAACLAEAYEQLDVGTADRLEHDLYLPVQRAFGRAKRTHAQFAERVELPPRAFEPASPTVRRLSVKQIVERGVTTASDADRQLADLQDSMLPIEAGDMELRTGLAEARELLGVLAGRAPQFLRTLGR